jgi:hypothetical protein
MLARSRDLFLPSGVVLKSPLLCPAFSSKGFPDIAKITEVMREFITSGVLVSAYDIFYKKISPRKITFPEFVILDSGGYEARVDYDLGKVNEQEHIPKPWPRKAYLEVLKSWPNHVPTVVVSYDSPREIRKLKDQIAEARATLKEKADLVLELLIKPENKNADFVSIENIIRRVAELRPFWSVGLTDKELGFSPLQKMTNIARLRGAMDSARIDAPIHIFGSLDTLSTALYFISGAEIFDGLTWLRYGYHEGFTTYGQNYGTIQDSNGLRRATKEQIIEMWKNNYYYLAKLRDEMINYVRTEDFGQFKHIGARLEDAFHQLEASL